MRAPRELPADRPRGPAHWPEIVIADLSSTNLLERLDAEALRQRGDAALLAVPISVDGRNSAVLELVESRAHGRSPAPT